MCEKLNKTRQFLYKNALNPTVDFKELINIFIHFLIQTAYQIALAISFMFIFCTCPIPLLRAYNNKIINFVINLMLRGDDTRYFFHRYLWGWISFYRLYYVSLLPPSMYHSIRVKKKKIVQLYLETMNKKKKVYRYVVDEYFCIVSSSLFFIHLQK